MPSRNSISKNKSLDWLSLSIYFSLVIIGWFMVFSTLYDEQNPYAFMDITTPVGAQTVWVTMSILIFLVTLTIDWKFWNVIAFPIYGISLILLILVLIFGKEINGAKAWFSFGFFSIQPAEWAKFATALAVSSYLSFNKSSITNTNVFLIALTLFLAPAALVMLQPDFGSALVFLSFFVLLYRRGMHPAIIIIGFIMAAIFIFSLLYEPSVVSVFLILIGAVVFFFNRENLQRATVFSLLLLAVTIFLLIQKEYFWVFLPPVLAFLTYAVIIFRKKDYKIITLVVVSISIFSAFGFGADYIFDNILKPHQKDRINVWLMPEKCDPRGSLYNIIQSKMAIGSGGLTGKGYLNGEMTKFNYVPEQSTDFIFTSIGEEQGFIGSVGVILLFTMLIIRCIIIAERANLEFIRNYGYAIAGILFVHFFLNIGMTTGLLPVVGIPLPFISKGGSSLTAFSIMIGVLIKMDMARFRSN
jgi:rod shape determining protein RodA